MFDTFLIPIELLVLIKIKLMINVEIPKRIDKLNSLFFKTIDNLR